MILEISSVAGAKCRLLVVKKHAGVLKYLREDLLRILNTDPSALDQLPALIIDDESDHASLDTRPPDQRELSNRRAVNREVTKLVKLFP